MFADLITILEDNGKGIHALRKSATEAYARAALHPDRAAPWYLMAALAQDFIDSNERMAVSTDKVRQQFELMTRHAALLDDAYASGDGAAQLTAINTVAASLTQPGGLSGKYNRTEAEIAAGSCA